LKQDNSTAYEALRRGVGLVDRSDLGRLSIGGADRRAYLQGLLTNDIEALTAGTGCYAALLTAQGRMVTDMRVLELGDEMLIDLPAELTASVAAHLERFVFSEDVQVLNVTAERPAVGVYGPHAAALVARLLEPAADLDALDLYATTRGTLGEAPVTIVSSDDPGVRGWDLVATAAEVAPLMRALRDAGAVDVDASTVETVRIEAGRPRFGTDMDADTIPLEAGIEDRAISRTKGCYVGQEVIVRVIDRGRGRVARHLVGLSFSVADALPDPGAVILSGGRDVGRVTSATHSPALGHPIALGYVHRDFTSPGTVVAVALGLDAVVADLPFVS
jgi:folate-binding protein YgfZ